MLLTDTQVASAIKYNRKEYEAARLTDEHIAIAMAAFQEDADITVDGMAGPMTREAIEDANAPDVEPAEPVLPGMPEGKGMFVRSFKHTGEPAEMVQKMKDNGLQWVCVQRIWQYEDKESSITNGTRLAEYAEAVHTAGFGFWLWGYPVPGKQDEFATVILEAADTAKAEGIVIDPEAPYKNTTGEATKLMQALMPGCVERKILLGFTSYGAPWFHKSFPWREFSTAHFAIPQNYDKDNNLGADYPTKSAVAYAEHGFKVIVPGSGAWNKTEAQMTAPLANTPTPQGAIIWWDWVNANKSHLWGPVAAFTPEPCHEVA